ncbi:MAG TPA: tRNA modification GTPase [Gemmataceae bacterium]|nr:tRNA modification GTPase [Gemmataceae bacterium]
MTPHLLDVIVALSTAGGPAGRAVLRLSGPGAAKFVAPLFRPDLPPQVGRQLLAGALHLPTLASPLPAELYLLSAPKTYTGQDMVEIHTLSCPPLLDVLTPALLHSGARAAKPGEFTMRAFLAGKLDLTRAEAVQAVVEAGDEGELKRALLQLAGGLARPLEQLREDLLDLLADVEAALDFGDEAISFVGRENVLHRLTRGLAQLTTASRQLTARAVADRPFRVVLAGRPNAGKSSLFNALGGQALVSAAAGTTRDYLIQRLDLNGAVVELVDTPGRRIGLDAVEEKAQALGREQADQADLVLLCLPTDEPARAEDAGLLRQERPPVLGVATKCDLACPPAEMLAVSAVAGQGLDALRAALAERVRSRPQPALASSLSRCRGHVEACLACLRRAHALVLYEDPTELLALELRGALEQLGEMVGAVYTDDLLDRIFSRFCIGK